MFMVIDANQAYWFHAEQIRTIEEKYQARYLGFWCIKDAQGRWSDTPVEVFYQSEPDLSQGHSHYFGMFVNRDQQVMITDARSAFSEPMTGILLKTGEVLVSRYTHDYRVQEGHSIDGGRDYLRTGGSSDLVSVTVHDGEFVFESEYHHA